MKTCTKCLQSKDKTSFSPKKESRDGLQSWCKKCTSCQSKKNSRSDRKHDLKRRYGIDEQEYTALFEKQKGFCAICNRHQCSFPKRLSVDHDHETGLIRGLLCNPCNIAIGNFEDDVERIKSAMEYLCKSKI